MDSRDLVAEVKDALAALSDARLIYVPGHSGYPLNDRVDELARLAIRVRTSQGWVNAERSGR